MMRQPIKQNLPNVNKGATWSFTFFRKQPDKVTPVSMVGYTARLQCRPSLESNDVLFELTTENGGIAIDGALGKVTLLMSASKTAELVGFGGVYDLELISGATVMRFFEGKVKFTPEVTR